MYLLVMWYAFVEAMKLMTVLFQCCCCLFAGYSTNFFQCNRACNNTSCNYTRMITQTVFNIWLVCFSDVLVNVDDGLWVVTQRKWPTMKQCTRPLRLAGCLLSVASCGSAAGLVESRQSVASRWFGGGLGDCWQ